MRIVHASRSGATARSRRVREWPLSLRAHSRCGIRVDLQGFSDDRKPMVFWAVFNGAVLALLTSVWNVPADGEEAKFQ